MFLKSEVMYKLHVLDLGTYMCDCMPPEVLCSGLVSDVQPWYHSWKHSENDLYLADYH